MIKREMFAIANKYQKKIIILVFFAMIIPVIITIFAMASLIFTLLAAEIPHKEIIIFNVWPAIMRSLIVMLTILPLSIILILLVSYRISNRLVGPIGRISRELDERINKNSKEHIILRKKDDLIDLANKINSILDKIH